MKVILLENYPHDGRESMRRYVTLLEHHLVEAGHQIFRWAPPVFFGQLNPSSRGLGKWLGYLDKFIIYPPILWWKAWKLKRDRNCVVHICDHSDAMYSFALSNIPHVVTCHDLTAIKAALGEVPGHRPKLTGRLYQRLILAGLKSASFTIAVSQATREDLLRIAGTKAHRVTVVRNGLNHPYHRLEAELTQSLLVRVFGRASKPVPPKFLIAIGSNAWHKNRSGLLDLYAEAVKLLPAIPPLVLAGDTLDQPLRSKAIQLLIVDRLIEAGKVSNEELNALYCGATALVFPSLAEGFGWPVIEAQACACPVVASSLPSLKEIGGLSPVFIDPADIPGAAAALVEVVIQSETEKRKSVLAGLDNAAEYGAHKMVEQIESAYRTVLGETT